MFLGYTVSKYLSVVPLGWNKDSIGYKLYLSGHLWWAPHNILEAPVRFRETRPRHLRALVLPGAGKCAPLERTLGKVHILRCSRAPEKILIADESGGTPTPPPKRKKKVNQKSSGLKTLRG